MTKTTNKPVYTMNGQEFTTLTAIATELGVKRVYQKDFEKYGITVTEPNADNKAENAADTVAQETTETVDENGAAEAPDAGENAADEGGEENADKSDTDETQNASEETEKSADDSKQDRGNKKKDAAPKTDRDIYKDELKAFDDKAIIKMVKEQKLNDYKEVTHAGIRRMRCIMQLVEAKFGKVERPSTAKPKVASPFDGKTNDELVAVLDKAKVATPAANEHAGVYRMRLIMAIKKAGLTV